MSMLNWLDLDQELASYLSGMTFGTQQERRKREAAHTAWLKQLEQRMSQADNPLTVSVEQKADVWEALIAHANERLPDGHPAKITLRDVERLSSITSHLPDLLIVDEMVRKLSRILPPPA